MTPEQWWEQLRELLDNKTVVDNNLTHDDLQNWSNATNELLEHAPPE